MFYELFYSATGPLWDFPGVGLFQYISFRTVAATVTAFLLAIMMGRLVIRWLTGAGIGENTDKTDSIKLAELHKSKKGTPTMGGVFLIGALLLSSVLWIRFDGFNAYSFAGIALVFWFAAVGLVDDWIKLKIEGRSGLSKKAKQGLMTVGAAGVCIYLLSTGIVHLEETAEGVTRTGPWLYAPFVSGPVFDLGIWLGVPFVALGILVLTGTANAVNFTDGLDGLAVGCVICATMAYAGICYFVGHQDLASYLLIEHVAGTGELTVMLGAMVGASFGFLWYNAAPAQIFMGDVGSLGLGAALGYAALVSRTEFTLFVVGGVFVIEALSVIIQIGSYKMRGKRVFLCAPLHHHFQFAGMPETRIVLRTWVVAALLAMSSLALFKVR